MRQIPQTPGTNLTRWSQVRRVWAGRGTRGREKKRKKKKIKKGNVGAGSFSPCFFSAAVAAWELIRNVLRARIALVS